MDKRVSLNEFHDNWKRQTLKKTRLCQFIWGKNLTNRELLVLNCDLKKYKMWGYFRFLDILFSVSKDSKNNCYDTVTSNWRGSLSLRTKYRHITIAKYETSKNYYFKRYCWCKSILDWLTDWLTDGLTY